MIPFHKNTFESIPAITSIYEMNTFDNYKEKCNSWFINKRSYPNFFFTKSCTQSLELALMSLNLPVASEVILPSFAFVSLANAINNLGFKCVFIDCDAITMNINPDEIEQAISPLTKAIITINYGGIACDYDKILKICSRYQLYLIEDNAHGINAKYKKKLLGNFGDISTFSFDYLKNITCYEGGGVVINSNDFLNQFSINYEFGTNRVEFLEGKSDFYEWKGMGSNARLAPPLYYYLAIQLERIDEIIPEFIRKWNLYHQILKPLEEKDYLSLVSIPQYAEHNGHIYWIKCKNKTERSRLMEYLKNEQIQTSFHYTPLHSSEYGKKKGVFRGDNKNTTTESERLLRLPLYHSILDNEISNVVECINKFYRI